MNDQFITQILLNGGSLAVLLPTMLGLYILALHPRQRANQATAAYTFLLAGINFTIMRILRAPESAALLDAVLRAYIALVPANGPATLFLVLYLLQPAWLRGANRRWRYFLWGMVFLPALLVLADTFLGTRLLYTAPQTFPPGQVPRLRELTGGLFGLPVRALWNSITTTGVLALIIFLLSKKRLSATQRGLAWWLLGVQTIALLLFVFGARLVSPAHTTLLVGVLFAVVYAGAAYQQRLIGRETHRIRIQPRLTLLIMTVVLPVIIFMVTSTNTLVYTLTRINADTRLNDAGTLVGNEVQQWLEFNTKALQQMAQQPEITSMDPALQEPALRSMAATHAYMYLVSTTDVLGRNVARSDGAPPKDYADRLWMQKALRGESPAMQVLIGRTSHQPALVMATPIHNQQGNIIGVAMFASTLSDLSDTVLQARIGEEGFAYLVDQNNLLVAHPSMSNAMLTQLENYAAAAPVAALRAAGQEAFTTYTDDNGITWRAYAAALPNGWAVVVQQPIEELLRTTRFFAGLSVALVLFLSGVLFLLIWVSIRQVVAPLETLTAAAQSIAEGNLEQRVPAESDDEIGALGRVLNQVTSRLRDAIHDLETRVAERTLALERRSAQLQAAAEVGNAISTIRSLDALLPRVAELISQRFDFYHTGIFLLDEEGEYMVLRAANSEGGRRMLARRHRLRVGTQGIVGYAAFTREPRIAVRVGDDAIHFENPDLPDTQSEMALPLIVGDELIGVLDVQSTRPDAFSKDDIQTLEVLARQVAVAIQNARLVEETRRLLEAQEEAAGRQTSRAWRRQVEALARPVVRRTPFGAEHPPQAVPLPRLARAEPHTDPDDPHLLHIPLRVRGLFIGHLQARKPADGPAWYPQEIAFMRSLSEELAPALESARLYQETQISAHQQRIAVDVAARLRQNLDLESILRTAVSQVQQALGLPEVAIQLGGSPDEEEAQ